MYLYTDSTFFPQSVQINFVRYIFIPYSQLQVPKTMCGAVLGCAALAPNNDNAINISFGDSGYTTALARIFKMVYKSC